MAAKGAHQIPRKRGEVHIWVHCREKGVQVALVKGVKCAACTISNVLLRHRLLRQTDGFEGRRSVFSEVRPLDGLTVAERPHVPDVSLNLDAARLSPTARPDESEHLVARVDHFLGLPASVSALPISPPSRSAQARTWLRPRRSPGLSDAARSRAQLGRGQVPNCLRPLVKQGVDAPHNLHVLLRHRPRSIPQAKTGSAPLEDAPRRSHAVRLYARAAAGCGRPIARSVLTSKYEFSLESPRVPSM